MRMDCDDLFYGDDKHDEDEFDEDVVADKDDEDDEGDGVADDAAHHSRQL